MIGNRLPNAYLPELVTKNGRPAVEALMQSHFISPAALEILLRNPFTPDDYDAFLRERQRTVTAAIQSLLIGGRVDLPADLRQLDEEVERIELELRELVADRLDDDLALLPDHIRPKIADRVGRMLKKNPGLDPADYEGLLVALQFADLTELLGVMQSATTAARFTDLFAHKETLIAKFGQLGELRNCIRHSRTVREVTRLEGQAAIHWFDGALAKTKPSKLAAAE